MSDVAGSTPEKYALKVRTHPGVLQISATNKMKTAITIQVTWSACLVESYALRKDRIAMEQNLNLLHSLMMSLSNTYEIKKGNFLWKNISPKFVIDFLGNFISMDNPMNDPRNVLMYINMQIITKLHQ